MTAPSQTTNEVPVSGCYPIGKGLTVAEVQEVLADGGLVAFRCDELDVCIVRPPAYEDLS